MNWDIYLEIGLACSLLIYPLYTSLAIWRSGRLDVFDVILLVWPSNVGVGVLVTYLFEATEWMIGANQALRTYLSFHLFFMALFTGALSCRALWGSKLNELEGKILSADPQSLRFWIWAALLASTCVRLYNFAAYGVLVSGTRGGGDYTYIEFVIGSVITSVEPLSLVAVAVAWAQKRIALWERLACAGSLLLFQLLEGRAPFLFALFIFFYFQIKSIKVIKIRTGLIGFGLLFITFLIVFPYFKSIQYGIRYKSEAVSRIELDDVAEIVGSVARGELASDAENLQEFNRRDLGATGRFYWITWNSMVVEGVSLRGSTFGSAFKNDLLFVLPRFIKGSRMETDNYIQENLGLPLFDATTNLVAIAYSDFGYAGSLLYGFLWPFVLGAFLVAVGSICYDRPLIVMLFYILILRSAFNFENSISITLVPIRSGLLFAIPLWFLAWRQLPTLRVGGGTGLVGGRGRLVVQRNG